MNRYYGKWESVNQHEVPQWYEDCKFGIFVHWGLPSVPAFAPVSWELGEVEIDENWFTNNPYADWYYNSVKVGKGPTYEYHLEKYGEDFKYEQFADLWKAENWKPEEWAQIFQESGAGYVVLTTKHHDGYCLFPSKYTDFNSSVSGPKRNIVGELTDEVRKKGMKMGLYYSGMLDWQFADDPIFSQEEQNYNACPTSEYADYAYNQCRELIEEYKPSVFWNDIGWPLQGEHNLPNLLAYYYNTVEDGVVNDRFNDLYKDYATKEYRFGEANREEKWEMCRGMGLSFGYNQNEGEEHLIAIDELIHLLVSTVANNGNLLLNVGPMADGTIPKGQVERLQEVGKWLKINGEAIFGTKCSDRKSQILENDIELHFTKKGEQEYLFIDKAPEGRVEIEIESSENTVQPLDPKLQVESSAVNGKVKIILLNHKKEDYTVALKI